MRIGICDDQPVCCERLKSQLEKYYRSLDVKMDAFGTGEQLIRAVEKDPYAYFCIFLDIEMPGKDGMETAEAVHGINGKLPVIFLTSHTEYAVRGYEVQAFRFLEKPVTDEALHRTLEAVRKTQEEGRKLRIRQDGKDRFLPVTEILYLKSENVYLVIHTRQESYLIRRKLADQRKELPETDFFQIHRSYIVNLSKVYGFDGKKVTLSDGTCLPVSRGKRAGFLDAVSRYMEEQNR